MCYHKRSMFVIRECKSLSNFEEYFIHEMVFKIIKTEAVFTKTEMNKTFIFFKIVTLVFSKLFPLSFQIVKTLLKLFFDML